MSIKSQFFEFWDRLLIPGSLIGFAAKRLKY